MSPGFISRVVVADKVALVGRMLDGIRTLPLDDLTAFTGDPRMVAAGDSYLRRALEALLDLARHVLAKGFARAPAEYAEVARQVGEVGVLAPALAHGWASWRDTATEWSTSTTRSPTKNSSAF